MEETVNVYLNHSNESVIAELISLMSRMGYQLRGRWKEMYITRIEFTKGGLG